MDIDVRNLLASRSWFQKFNMVALVVLYGLMSYQYLAIVISNKPEYHVDKVLLNVRFIFNFLWFSLPMSSTNTEVDGGYWYWFLFSALAFIVFFVALVIRTNKISINGLLIIFISAHISQMAFFYMLYQRSIHVLSKFDLGVPLLVGVTSIILSILLFRAKDNLIDPTKIIIVSFLAFTVAALFIVHDFYNIYNAYMVRQYNASLNIDFKEFFEFLTTRSSIHQLPFLIVRCCFVIFYSNIFISLIKTALKMKQEKKSVLEYTRTQDTKKKLSVTATSNHNNQAAIKVKRDSSKTIAPKSVVSAESKSTLSPEKINQSEMLTLNQVKTLESLTPAEVYFTISSVFDSLQRLGCSRGSVDAGVLFYLAYQSGSDKMLEHIVNHIRQYGSSQDPHLFADVVTELSLQMKLTVAQSQQLKTMIQGIINKMNM